MAESMFWGPVLQTEQITYNNWYKCPSWPIDIVLLTFSSKVLGVKWNEYKGTKYPSSKPMRREKYTPSWNWKIRIIIVIILIILIIASGTPLKSFRLHESWTTLSSTFQLNRQLKRENFLWIFGFSTFSLYLSFSSFFKFKKRSKIKNLSYCTCDLQNIETSKVR